MPELPQYSYRDRIKFACFNYALNRGMDEETMIGFFTQAAERVRGMEKSAFFSLKDIKRAIIENGSIAKTLKGTWVLTDKQTGHSQR